MYALLEDRLVKDLVKKALGERPLFDLLSAHRGQQTYVGLRKDRPPAHLAGFFVDLLDVSPDVPARIETVPHRQLEVHYHEIVGGTILLEARLNHFDGLLAVGRQVRFYLVLVKDADERVRAEQVILHDQYLDI